MSNVGTCDLEDYHHKEAARDCPTICSFLQILKTDRQSLCIYCCDSGQSITLLTKIELIQFVINGQRDPNCNNHIWQFVWCLEKLRINELPIDT